MLHEVPQIVADIEVPERLLNVNDCVLVFVQTIQRLQFANVHQRFVQIND